MKDWEAILEQFFGECLRYWEKTLGVDSDLSKEPYINAIKEIPHNNPYKKAGEEIPKEIRDKFIKYRLMDCYGNEWEKHLTEVM